MKHLTLAFLKIFFRNPQAVFFVIFLPAGLFVILAFLGLEEIVRFDLKVSYLDFLLVGIIAMALMQTGIYTVAYTFIDYRRSQILKRLSVTPLSPAKFLWAQIFARFLIACLQASVLLVLAAALFDTQVKSLALLPLLVFLGSTLFLNFGFLIAAFARDYEAAAPYTAILGLPLVFLGDVFFPVANLPSYLQNLANLLPLKPLSAILRHFLIGVNSPDLGREIAILLIWFLGLSLIAQHIFAKKVYK